MAANSFLSQLREATQVGHLRKSPKGCCHSCAQFKKRLSGALCDRLTVTKNARTPCGVILRFVKPFTRKRLRAWDSADLLTSSSPCRLGKNQFVFGYLPGEFYAPFTNIFCRERKLLGVLLRLSELNARMFGHCASKMRTVSHLENHCPTHSPYSNALDYCQRIGPDQANIFSAVQSVSRSKWGFHELKKQSPHGAGALRGLHLWGPRSVDQQ